MTYFSVLRILKQLRNYHNIDKLQYIIKFLNLTTIIFCNVQ